MLAELDGMLAKAGHAPMTEPERSVAVRKLIEATGTRGATFALSAARDAVLNRRRRG